LGYALFLTSAAPLVGIVAALLILGWEPLSVPVTFTTVGSTVADSGRGMAFALQSIQKRLPKILGPLVAGVGLGASGRGPPRRGAGGARRGWAGGGGGPWRGGGVRGP